MATEEAALVRRCLRGEPEAIRSLVDRFQTEVFSLCVRLLSHRQDAEDVTQEVFLRIFRSLKRWDSARPLKPWIIGITVNRWPHGYAYTYSSLYDPMDWVFTSTSTRPCVVGRQPFGLISIANSDAAASPHTDAAFLEAHRAVGEVLERRAEPLLTQSSSTGG